MCFLLMASVLAAQAGALLELTGDTPSVKFGPPGAPTLTLIHNTTEDKLTCSGKIQAADILIEGMSVASSIEDVGELRQEVATLRQEMAALRQQMAGMATFVGLKPPPPPRPQIPGGYTGSMPSDVTSGIWMGRVFGDNGPAEGACPKHQFCYCGIISNSTAEAAGFGDPGQSFTWAAWLKPETQATLTAAPGFEMYEDHFRYGMLGVRGWPPEADLGKSRLFDGASTSWYGAALSASFGENCNGFSEDGAKMEALRELFDDHRWHHVAKVEQSPSVDGTGSDQASPNQKVYIDGVLFADTDDYGCTGTGHGDDHSSAMPFHWGAQPWIGSNDGPNGYYGAVAHVGIYSSMLTQAEIQSLMTNFDECGTNPSSLACWRLDAATDVANIPDESMSGSHNAHLLYSCRENGNYYAIVGGDSN